MTVQGVWKNEYGSEMALRAYPGGLVFGTYSSDTGSTGKYYVVGWQQATDPSTTEGQPVALAIDWHSIEGGTGDNSWHWTSGLSGQLSIQDGSQQLVLAHAMVASTDFPGLCAAGTYVDKLIYTRASEDEPDLERPDAADAPAVGDPLEGTWKTPDGSVTLVLRVNSTSVPGLFGWVSGQIQTAAGAMMVEGVTDINATPDGLALQSVSFAALDRAGGAIVHSGTLDLSSGALTLLGLASVSTAPNATYVQTTALQRTFRKQS